jgi:hypothetical protein
LSEEALGLPLRLAVRDQDGSASGPVALVPLGLLLPASAGRDRLPDTYPHGLRPRVSSDYGDRARGDAELTAYAEAAAKEPIALKILGLEKRLSREERSRFGVPKRPRRFGLALYPLRDGSTLEELIVYEDALATYLAARDGDAP